MAKSLVEMLTGDFEPEKYHDNYREALLELIERKARGPGDQAAGAGRRQGHRPDGGAARERRGGDARDASRASQAQAEERPRRNAAKPARRRKAG